MPKVPHPEEPNFVYVDPVSTPNAVAGHSKFLFEAGKIWKELRCPSEKEFYDEECIVSFPPLTSRPQSKTTDFSSHLFLRTMERNW